VHDSESGFGFLVPDKNSEGYHGTAVRFNFDTFSVDTVTVLDLMGRCGPLSSYNGSVLPPECRLSGFHSGFKDSNDRGYFIGFGNPDMHGKLVRAPLKTFDSFEFIDLALKDPQCKGFVGGFAAGDYSYLFPGFDGVISSSKIVRVNLADFDSIETLDLSMRYRDLKGFYGAFVSGSYGFLVPDQNIRGLSTLMPRFNFGIFSVQTVDYINLALQGPHKDPGLGGFRGHFLIGTFAYLVPHNNGSPFGKVPNPDKHHAPPPVPCSLLIPFACDMCCLVPPRPPVHPPACLPARLPARPPLPA
jgi:hypothetical protein